MQSRVQTATVRHASINGPTRIANRGTTSSADNSGGDSEACEAIDRIVAVFFLMQAICMEKNSVSDCNSVEGSSNKGYRSVGVIHQTAMQETGNS